MIQMRWQRSLGAHLVQLSYIHHAALWAVHQMVARMMEKENLGNVVVKVAESLQWVTMQKTMSGQICQSLSGQQAHSRRLLGLFMQIMQVATLIGYAKCQREA